MGIVPGHAHPPAALRSARAAALALMALVLVLVGGTTVAHAVASGERVVGTLNNAGTPVEGVTISVERGGAEVATGQTNDAGRFEIDVPGPGDYTVVLDTGTLPDGVELRREGGERVEVTVRPGGSGAALFLLGENTNVASTRLDRAPQLLVGGIQFGLVLAMGSIGLSLIFGTTGLTNFAHGELITGGALLGYVVNVGFGVNLIPATIIAVLVGGAAGFALDRGLWRPLRRRGTGLIAMLVVSIGLAFVLRYLYLIYFGGSSRSYAQYATQSPVDVGPVGILPRDMVIMGVSVLVLVLVGLALQRTRFGKATRAVADNPSLAASSGIDVDRVISVVWVFGAALAVLGGVFLALSQQVGFQLGQNALLLLFAAVTLGGLGTAYGALAGALVIGVFTQLSTLFIAAELQVVGALIVLILVLIVRPQGILGSRERIG
ncbi:MAG: Branched-chain amino acid ABC-type transport system, permease component [Frankiales bacterium]|nr:Branched-chain amino acid ABC-type transport system, permease component [Frankiales bacterium]